MKIFLIFLISFNLGVGLAYWFWKPDNLVNQINFEKRQKELMEESIKEFQDNQSVIEQKLRSAETELGFCIQGKG